MSLSILERMKKNEDKERQEEQRSLLSLLPKVSQPKLQIEQPSAPINVEEAPIEGKLKPKDMTEYENILIKELNEYTKP